MTMDVRIIIGKVIALEKNGYYFVIINRREAITSHKYYAKSTLQLKHPVN